MSCLLGSGKRKIQGPSLDNCAPSGTGSNVISENKNFLDLGAESWKSRRYSVSSGFCLLNPMCACTVGSGAKQTVLDLQSQAVASKPFIQTRQGPHDFPTSAACSSPLHPHGQGISGSRTRQSAPWLLKVTLLCSHTGYIANAQSLYISASL